MVKDDRILPLTRLIAAIVVPILALAFVILYFFPQLTGTRFAWEINPPLTAMFMGAGYIGGAWLLLWAAIGRQWHRVAAGFPTITAFTTSMLLVTVLHWSRFDLGHLPFQLWLVLYVVTPFLIPTVWWRNRGVDAGHIAAGDQVVPLAARRGLQALGVVLLLFAVAGMINPAFVSGIWPWTLSPLTARVLSGWFALLGVGGLVIGGEARWSGWTIGLQAIAIWHVLVLIAIVQQRATLRGGLLNWYVLSVVIVLAGMAGLVLWMRRKPA